MRQSSTNYEQERFNRFYVDYCNVAASTNNLKDLSKGCNLVTMSQWMEALKSEDNLEQHVKMWCYFVGKPMFYEKEKFFNEFVNFCNEKDSGSTTFSRLSNEDKPLKNWFMKMLRNKRKNWKMRMKRQCKYHLSTSQNFSCNKGIKFSTEERKEAALRYKTTRQLKNKACKGAIYFKHPTVKGKDVEKVTSTKIVLIYELKIDISCY